MQKTSRGYFLEKREGSCVFLGEDGLCAIHAAHGAEAKPAFCRTFPFTLVDQPGGTTHALRQDCGGHWQSMETGTPVSESLAALPANAPRLVFRPQNVQVLPGVGVSTSDWLQLEDHLVDLVDESSDPGENIVRLREALFAALRRTPPPPDPGEYHQILTTLGQGLLDTVEPQLPPAADTSFPAQFLRQVHRGLATALDHVGAQADLDATTRRWWALGLRQGLRGKAFQSLGDVSSFLGLALLGTELARARRLGGGLPEIAPWYVLWSRFVLNANVRDALRSNRSALFGLLVRLDKAPPDPKARG